MAEQRTVVVGWTRGAARASAFLFFTERTLGVRAIKVRAGATTGRAAILKDIWKWCGVIWKGLRWAVLVLSQL